MFAKFLQIDPIISTLLVGFFVLFLFAQKNMEGIKVLEDVTLIDF